MEKSSTSRVPLVVQIGFAGSRRLIDASAFPGVDKEAFERALEEKIVQELKDLPSTLGVGDGFVFCGISQIAIGADTCFARACARLNIPHRIFLPQPRDQYLAAIDEDGTPDFNEAQRHEAIRLLDHANVIQERVVSESSNRITRFEETNIEISRVCDVAICVVGTLAGQGAGGTHDFIQRVMHRKTIWIVIQFSMGPEQLPVFETSCNVFRPFSVPHAPPELAKLNVSLAGNQGVIDIPDHFDRLTGEAEKLSKRSQGLFKTAASLIIGAHVAATACAVVVVVWHPAITNFLLGLEVVLLLTGYGFHRWLQRSRAAGTWSMARLLAQTVYSLQALREVKAYPRYLFTLPMPESLRPLRRSLCVLHLQATRNVDPAEWPKHRDNYLRSRVEDQQRFYTRALGKWRRHQTYARRTFVAFTAVAVIAATLKFLLSFLDIHVDVSLAAMAAILAPVIAVAALSLSASLEHDFLVQAYTKALEFLEGRKELLEVASSEREFTALAMEVEAYLLGETVAWYTRRAHTEVT